MAHVDACHYGRHVGTMRGHPHDPPLEQHTPRIPSQTYLKFLRLPHSVEVGVQQMNKIPKQRTRRLAALEVAPGITLPTAYVPWTFLSSVDKCTAKGYVGEIVLIPQNLTRTE